MSWKRIGCVLAVMTIGLAIGCSGARKLEKGETVRCPACGVVFPVEEGAKK